MRNLELGREESREARTQRVKTKVRGRNNLPEEHGPKCTGMDRARGVPNRLGHSRKKYDTISQKRKTAYEM